MKAKEESENSGLKFNIQKMRIMASRPITLSGECGISSVLSRHNKNLKWQMLKPSTCLSSRTNRVTAQFYLENKRKYIVQVWGHADPKDMKRRERKCPSPLAPLFICFYLLLLGLPYVNGLARSAVCSTWGAHSGPWTFLCSIFTGFSLMSFSHCHSWLLFPILTA